MAYSQVERASCFGGVLKDHNRRERCNRECNSMASAAFQKNLKEFVRDHLHNCISVSSDADENMQNHHRQHLRCLTNYQNDDNNNHDDSSSIGCKSQATILDRWAATQAQDMVSTIQEMVASHNSSDNSQNSGSLINGGASSLVQIWEARLHASEQKLDRSISMKNNPTSRTYATNASPHPTEPKFDRSVSMMNDPTTRNCAAKADSMADWDSTAPSSSSSVHLLGRSASEGGGREKVRIVDIIRRLTSDTTNCNEQGSSSVGDPPLRRSSEPPELKAFSVAVNVNSPKIRGRQAFHDLLLHMERERQRELDLLAQRHSVSRFPQRGRIQAMLRLRFLQRGMAIQDQQRSQSIRLTAASNATNGSHQGSTIMSLRARFSRGVADDGTSSLTAAATSKNSAEIENSIVNNLNSSKLNQVIKNNSMTEQQAESQTDDSLSQMSEVHEESSASSDVTWQGSSEANNFDQGEIFERSLEANNFDPGEVFESTPSTNNWDGDEMDYEEVFESNNYDWFAGIARPRSYWEDRRKEWYQEMLSTSSENNDIKQLLERRTVSNFLASDFREKMNKLMVSHAQIQANQEDEELEEEGHDRIGRLMLSFFRRQSHLLGSQPQEDHNVVEGGGDGDVEEGQVLHEEVDEHEEEEEESPASTHSPSPFRSPNYTHRHQVADDSDQLSHPSPRSETANQESQIFPAPNRSSSEMDLMNDLRGQMEQLQREMSEIRKAMQTCMEMQAKLQNSVKQEVHLVEAAANNSFDMARRRKCCICYEMQVDSFLYRCGHMCTCLKCAHELQWSCGKCPICRASILDVVRAYMDS